ncbi:hypothetical protein AABB24_030009 [Solanum stoloniferum]|uniref:SEP domain-containing protein n=1 Tax=Solanum stoloniferum TaxID=62892 RepID=A0ABD2S0I4_9SOLN
MEKKANEALINTFCEITSSSKSQALFFLESHNFDLDSAVSTFLENSSLPSAGPGTAAADPVSPSDSQSYSPSHSESSSPSSRSRSPSPPPPPSLSSKRKRKPSSNAYNLRSSRPRNNAAAADVADTVGGGRRSLRRRPTTGSESNSDEPQEANTGGEKSGMLVQDPSKENDADALFNQARQCAAVEGPSEHLPSSVSRSFTGAARRLTEEAVPSVPQPPENATHAITFWRNGFTVDDGPPRSFDDPENASFVEDGALPLQDAALNVNVQLSLVGSIGVADPARNMVAERDQEAQRDRVVAIARCPRFEARSCLAPPFRSLADPNIETAILASASNFPIQRITYPGESTFIPCFISVLYYLNQMDHLMVSTKRWTDNCMGWVPPYSQIYISILLYIQVIRAMDSAGIFLVGSRLPIFLRELETLFPFTNLWIPGPLVSAFKNLSCFWPLVSLAMFLPLCLPLSSGPRLIDSPSAIDLLCSFLTSVSSSPVSIPSAASLPGQLSLNICFAMMLCLKIHGYTF